jgi:murein DD-endopeptidase MepM/ murein hydrolase activator NlpD
MKRKILFVLLTLAFLQANYTEAATLFRSPISTFKSPAFSAYRDDNRTTSAVKDYKCGSLTYDQHQGTDFRADVSTQVYASANGGAYQTYNSCATTGSLTSTCGPGLYGNQVRIDHAGTNYYDGKGLTTIYAHLEKGTVIGPSSLLCGAKIGKSGSSGKSSGPHLHFEVRTDGLTASTAIDPFSGSCSQPTSYWVGLDTSGRPKSTCQ